MLKTVLVIVVAAACAGAIVGFVPAPSPADGPSSFHPSGPPSILAPMDYRIIQVTPCSPVIGADIRGVQELLGRPLVIENVSSYMSFVVSTMPDCSGPGRNSATSATMSSKQSGCRRRMRSFMPRDSS